MKSKVLILLLSICVLNISAQEQNGIVKTVGRPGNPGKPLGDVMLHARGNYNMVLSDDEGAFSLNLHDLQQGQAFIIDMVSKKGYKPADAGIIGRRYPLSYEVPLEISMISNEEYTQVKRQIEERIQARIESEYKSKYDELYSQFTEKAISLEKYSKQVIDLESYYDHSYT